LNLKKLGLLLLLLITPAALTACSAHSGGTAAGTPAGPPAGASAEASAGTIHVQAVITRDFGKEILSEKTLALPEKSSAMEALSGIAQVDTAYNGGFVKGIDGISSKYQGAASAKQDWFVFINGVLANTGALDYSLYAGDIEQWDFHTWSFHQSVPAVIGHFPQPFKQGYAGKVRPTIITYSDDFKDQAVSLKKYFTDAGIQNVSLTAIAGLTEKEKQEGNIILIALPENGLINELNQNWRRLGFYAYLEKDSIVAMTAEGKKAQTYAAGTGWIQATQNPWNPDGIGAGENVVWLITGTDIAGVQSAANSLINRCAELKYACAAIVAGSEIVRLPQ
jgi:hypothetical protein